MKTTKEILKSTGILFIVLFIFANKIENGASNAVSMYFVVFTFPLILVSILNGFWLYHISKMNKENKTKRILSFIPILILIILSFMKNIRIPQIDGALAVIGIVGGIGIGINNLIWNYQLKGNL